MISTTKLVLAVGGAVAGVWALYQLGRAAAQDKIIAAAANAGATVTVNPPSSPTLTVAPSSRQTVQLAVGANAYGLRNQVALLFPMTASIDFTPPTGTIKVARSSSGATVTAVGSGPSLVTVSFGDPTGKTDAEISIGVA